MTKFSLNHAADDSYEASSMAKLKINKVIDNGGEDGTKSLTMLVRINLYHSQRQ